MKTKKRKSTRSGYVYLMERTSNRKPWTVLTGQREIKIGIAKKPTDRQKDVDRGIPGRVVLLEQYKIRDVFAVESYLHRLYRSRNLKIRAKPGSGGTEFFRLNGWQLYQVRRKLRKESGTIGGFQWVWIWIVLMVIYFLIL